MSCHDRYSNLRLPDFPVLPFKINHFAFQMVVNQRDQQNESCNGQDAEFEGRIKNSADNPARKKETDDRQPQCNRSQKHLPLFGLRIEKKLREFDSQIGKKPGQMRCSYGSVRNGRDQRVLQTHRKKQAACEEIRAGLDEPSAGKGNQEQDRTFDQNREANTRGFGIF